MKKLIFLLLIFINLSPLLAKEGNQSIDSIINVINLNTEKINDIEKNLNGLSSDMQHIEYAISQQKDIISQEQSAIENILGASNRHLDIFALIIGVIGIILGIFITRKENNINKILLEINNAKAEVEKTKNNIESLNQEINANIKNLYYKLREEETTALLERLVDVPLDIDNIASLLLSRTLRNSDFDILFKAYKNLDKEFSKDMELEEYDFADTKNKYLLLFFQHFCGKSLLQDELRDEIIKFFPIALNSAFKCDVINSLNSMIPVLNQYDFEISKVDIITNYIEALNESRNKFYLEPYNLILEKSESINLQNVWIKLIDKKVIIEIFGNLLCEKYKDDEDFIKSVREQITEHKKESKINSNKSQTNE